jgi:hypothetical protein
MRIYTSCSDPIDFCKGCAPDEDEAQELFGNGGDGPDGRGNCFDYDCEHPPYDGEGYTCHECGEELTDGD